MEAGCLRSLNSSPDKLKRGWEGVGGAARCWRDFGVLKNLDVRTSANKPMTDCNFLDGVSKLAPISYISHFKMLPPHSRRFVQQQVQHRVQTPSTTPSLEAA